MLLLLLVKTSFITLLTHLFLEGIFDFSECPLTPTDRQGHFYTGLWSSYRQIAKKFLQQEINRWATDHTAIRGGKTFLWPIYVSLWLSAWVGEWVMIYNTQKLIIINYLRSYIHSSRVKLIKMFIWSSSSRRKAALRWWLSCTDRSL